MEEALTLEIIISILVVIILVLNLRASILISSLLPLGVLITFIAMRYFGVAANIVALSGIAIAIGVMVDVAVVFTENIYRHLQLPENRTSDTAKKLQVVHQAVMEVAPAVITALATTVVSFIPVFALQAQEGKLFTPLAITKTLAMLAALFIGLVILPTSAYWVFKGSLSKEKVRKIWGVVLAASSVPLMFMVPWAAVTCLVLGLVILFKERLGATRVKFFEYSYRVGSGAVLPDQRMAAPRCRSRLGHKFSISCISGDIGAGSHDTGYS